MPTSKKIHKTPIEQRIVLKRDGTFILPAEIAARLSGRSSLTLRGHAGGTLELSVPTPAAQEPGGEQAALGGDGTVTLPERYSIGTTEDIPYHIMQRPDGVIELRSLEPRDPDQWWYWTEEWQQKEREADEAYAAGRFKQFDNVEDFLADLDANRET